MKMIEHYFNNITVAFAFDPAWWLLGFGWNKGFGYKYFCINSLCFSLLFSWATEEPDENSL